MSLGWVVVGTLTQLLLAVLLFLLAAFGAASIGNMHELTDFQRKVLKLSILLLPASCVASALIVIYADVVRAAAYSYWWYVLPVPTFAAYMTYAVRLNSRTTM